MPTVTVRRDDLYRHLGKTFTIEEFEDLCFQFGIELDGEDEMEGGHAGLRIEVPANRYDLLCREGLGTALGVFLKTIPPPVYHAKTPENPIRLFVKKSTSGVRSYMLGAVLRNVAFTEASYASFIDLQEKLHHNVCRRRALVSVGTHDLNTVSPPFTYEALPSEGFRFVPLNQTEEVDGDGMIRLLESHQQLKQYLHLIKDGRYPVFLDSLRRVCSAPPIINSELSKITVNTRNVFIDVTATDLTKAHIVLNTIVAAFSMHCEKPFEIEPIVVEYEEGHKELSGKVFDLPLLSSRQVEFSLKYVRDLTGIPGLTGEMTCELLERMMIPTVLSNGDAKDTKGDATLTANVPITRSDVLHPCDLAEDVAIAFGYNNIPTLEFSSVKEQDINSLTEQVRREVANSGYHECLLWGLLSVTEAFESFRRVRPAENAQLPQAKATDSVNASEVESKGSVKQYEYTVAPLPVRIGNPKTREFEMVRTSLLPGLLKALHANQHIELPVKLFEVGDVVRIDDTNAVGARNHRQCAALIANNTGSLLEEIHGLLDSILKFLQLTAVYEDANRGRSTQLAHNSERKYKLVPTDEDPAFLCKRRVDIVVEPEGLKLGIMGVIHPEVLQAFAIPIPVSAFEFTLDPFVQWMHEADL